MKLGPEYDRALSCSSCRKPYAGNEDSKCTYDRYDYHILIDIITQEIIKSIHGVQELDEKELILTVEYVVFNLIYVRDVLIFFKDLEGNEFILSEHIPF